MSRKLGSDGLVTLNIPAGSKILNADGTPTYLNDDPDIFSIAKTPSFAPPAGYTVVSAYELNPTGVTFSLPINLTIDYSNGSIPAGAQTVIAYYSEALDQWVNLETAGYVAADGSAPADVATCRVEHFTYFAVLAK